MEEKDIESLLRISSIDEPILSFALLSGGPNHRTYKVVLKSKTYVLKVFSEKSSLIGWEKPLFKRLKKADLAPSLVFTSKKPVPFSLYEFCSYDPIANVPLQLGCHLNYDLGKALGQIHKVSFETAGLFGKGLSIQTLFPEKSSPYFTFCLENLTQKSLAWQRLGSDLSQKLRAYIENHESSFPKIEGGGCLVHGDFKPVNLLWKQGSGVKVLDWEYSHSGHALFDLGILLRHSQDIALDCSFFEKGYRSQGGTLLHDWKKRAQLVDLVNIIDRLNRSYESPSVCQYLIDKARSTVNL